MLITGVEIAWVIAIKRGNNQWRDWGGRATALCKSSKLEALAGEQAVPDRGGFSEWRGRSSPSYSWISSESIQQCAHVHHAGHSSDRAPHRAGSSSSTAPPRPCDG